MESQDDYILIEWWYVDNPINPRCHINWDDVDEWRD